MPNSVHRAKPTRRYFIAQAAQAQDERRRSNCETWPPLIRHAVLQGRLTVCCQVGTRVTSGLNWPMIAQNVVWTRAPCNGRIHVKSRAHGKIADSWMFFDFFQTRITARSPWRMNGMWKLWGFTNMVFLWRFSVLLWDMRAICGTHSSGVTRLPSFYVEKQQWTPNQKLA